VSGRTRVAVIMGGRVAPLRVARVGETMFPPRAPFLGEERLAIRGAQVTAAAEDCAAGEPPGSPGTLPHTRPAKEETSP
jgi:hypothetical protein